MADSEVEKLNDRLRKVRGLLKLTQKDLSESLGLKPSTYASYEYGQAGIPPEHMAMLRSKYQLSMDWLITGEGEPFPGSGPGAHTQVAIGNGNVNQIHQGEMAARIATLEAENDLLRKAVADKETIIGLLKRNGERGV